MSKLIIEICKITDILSHNNADKLELAIVKGWQCIVQKGQHKVGELIIFIPPDAIIPQKLIEFYKLEFLKKNSRIDTIKLRGEISQGLILDTSCLPPGKYLEGTDVAELLGITKYEPPEPKSCSLGGQQVSKKRINPLFGKYTDIENINNFNQIFQEGEEVIITEKIHGCNARYANLPVDTNRFWGVILKLFGKNYEFVYGSHEVQKKWSNIHKGFYKEDVWGKIARKYKFAEWLPKDYIIYGEIFGCLHWHTPILLANGKKIPIGKIVNQKIKTKVLSYNFEKQKIEQNNIIGFKRIKGNQQDWLEITYQRKHRGGKNTTLKITKNHICYTKDYQEIFAKDLNMGDVLYLYSPMKINYVQEQLLIGSLLGDTSYRKNIFRFSHSIMQKDYLKFKYKILYPFVNDIFHLTSGFGSEMLVFDTNTIQNKSNFLFDKFYIKKRKIINLELLNKLSPIAWAFWYMDDGSLRQTPNKSDISVLCTQSFHEKEIDIIIDYFNSKRIECYKIITNRLKKQYIIQFSPSGTMAFQSLIAPYVVSSMKYKLSLSFRNIKSFWDNYKNNNQSGLIETKIIKIKEGIIAKGKYLDKYDIEIENNHNYFANNCLVHNSGIQELTYGLDDIELRIFDIKYKGKYLNWDEFIGTINYFQHLGLLHTENKELLHQVPTLFRGKYSKEMEKIFAQGNSKIAPAQIREGCIIKPIVEREQRPLGRVILKSINENYLLLKNRTEFH